MAVQALRTTVYSHGSTPATSARRPEGQSDERHLDGIGGVEAIPTGPAPEAVGAVIEEPDQERFVVP